MTYREHMKAAERAYFTELVARGLSVSEIAGVSGLNRTALYRILGRHGLWASGTREVLGRWSAMAQRAKVRAAFQAPALRAVGRLTGRPIEQNTE